MTQRNPIDAKRVARPVSHDWLAESVFSPLTVQVLMVAALLGAMVQPVTLPLLLLSTTLYLVFFSDRPFKMPLRMPKDIDVIDRTTLREGFTTHNGLFGFFRFITRKQHYAQAEGILCLGYARQKNLARELWLTLTDALRHMQLVATTGSGKTEALISIELNTLCWGKGLCYSDGKASISFAFAVWSLARRFGREDDFYVLNFLNGGRDKFEALLGDDKKRPQSNTINLFGAASAAFIIQLMESLLPQAGAGDAGWQDKAKSMLAALVYAVYYKCKRDNIPISQEMLQKHLPLRKFAELYLEAKENDWHVEAISALENYLNTLAGFRMELVEKPSEWDQSVIDQHGFLIQQFNRMLTMFNDVYGHVFAKDGGDIDIKDVLHNDRILVVLIPALELSKSEAANIGKLYISAIRMTMARDLGFEVEGARNDILIDKKFTGKAPYPVIFDELGSYFAPGIDDMAAQMRSLGYMLVISAQDIQRFIAQHKGEYMTVNANLLTKWWMALQDEKDTYELAKITGGKGYFAELGDVKQTGGFVAPNYEDGVSTYIREKERLTLDELKDLNPGEGVISFKSALVRSSAIYIPDDEKLSSKLPMAINRFVEVKKPTENDLISNEPSLRKYFPPTAQQVNNVLRKLNEQLTAKKPTKPATLVDPILQRLISVALDLDNRCDVSYTPEQRGILLFEAAKEVMEQQKRKGHWFTLKPNASAIKVSAATAKELAPRITDNL